MFLKDGYEGTSLNAIADEVGVTKPAIYYHFENKDELFLSMFQHVWDGMSTEYFGLVREAPDLQETLRAIFGMLEGMEDTFITIIGESNVPETGFLPLLLDGIRRYPEVRAILDRFYRQVIEILAQRIEEERVAGTVREEVDPDAVALAVMAMVEGLLLLAAVAPSVSYRGKEAQLYEMVWSGIER